MVSAVEKSDVVLALHHFRDLLPLLESWVDTSWVVRTSVEQEHGTLRGSLKVANKTGKVQPARSWLVVSVLAHLHASILHKQQQKHRHVSNYPFPHRPPAKQYLHNWNVVAPGWVWHVNRRTLAQELGEEFTGKTNSTSPRNGLHTRDSLFLESLAVVTVGELQGEIHEVLHTRNASVLLVLAGRHDALFSFQDRRQHVWLRSDTAHATTNCSLASRLNRNGVSSSTHTCAPSSLQQGRCTQCGIKASSLPCHCHHGTHRLPTTPFLDQGPATKTSTTPISIIRHSSHQMTAARTTQKSPHLVEAFGQAKNRIGRTHWHAAEPVAGGGGAELARLQSDVSCEHHGALRAGETIGECLFAGVAAWSCFSQVETKASLALSLKQPTTPRMRNSLQKPAIFGSLAPQEAILPKLWSVLNNSESASVRKFV